MTIYPAKHNKTKLKTKCQECEKTDRELPKLYIRNVSPVPERGRPQRQQNQSQHNQYQQTDRELPKFYIRNVSPVPKRGRPQRQQNQSQHHQYQKTD